MAYAAETDFRLQLLNTLLTTPHRRLDAIYPVHRDIVTQDPRFYVRLAAWYADQGDVRDHKEMFVVNLVLSDFAGHRDVGLALLRALPPYEVVRVVDFINGRKKNRKVKGGDGAALATVEEFGLFRNPPRALKTEVSRYLREREADADWFDSSVLVARKAIKRLYALLHVKPDVRAQRILFEEEPPADSRLFALRALAKAATPAEQARAVVEHGIPYRVAATVVKQMTPAVLLALVERMSPQELINNVGSLKRRGALDIAEVKEAVEGKLAAAKIDGRVSAYKARVAADAAGASGELARALDEVTESRVKAKGRIKRPTALLVDKSGSMSVAIDVGRRLGAMVSAVCEADLFAYAFDTIAYPLEPSGKSLADWEKALAGVRAGGGTSCGVALDWMRRKKQRVEQVVLVTDEGENQAPTFKDAYEAYVKELNVRPAVILVKVGQAVDLLERVCHQLGVAPNVFTFAGDYYALPNVIPLLLAPSQQELLMEILDYPLPQRKSR
jgi:hypothetical protein